MHYGCNSHLCLIGADGHGRPGDLGEFLLIMGVAALVHGDKPHLSFEEKTHQEMSTTK